MHIVPQINDIRS